MLTGATWAAPLSLDGIDYYEYVSGSFSWSEANTLATSSSFNGVSGTLAIIDSQIENDFISSIVGGDAWIGATDEAAEGEWRWVDGRQFWQGNGSGGPVGGLYSSWGPGEPNNNGNIEDWAYIGPNGLWNDQRTTHTAGYVVEYSGVPEPTGLVWALFLGAACLRGSEFRSFFC